MIRTTTGELIAALDKDIENVEKNLRRLDDLRSNLVKRDEKSLNLLLQKIRSDEMTSKNNDTARSLLRDSLAQMLGLDATGLNLSALAKHLPADLAEQLKERRQHLLNITQKLKSEYAATVILLADCARFNKALLNGILGQSRTSSMEYNKQGSTRRTGETTFVNVKF